VAANSSGHAFNFFESGQNVFWVCIFIANLTLLRMHHNWTGWGEGLLLLAAVSYFLIAYIESQYTMFPVVYKFWEESTSSTSAWYGAIFAICSLFTIDYMIMRVSKLRWEFINPAFKTNHFIDVRPEPVEPVENDGSFVKHKNDSSVMQNQLERGLKSVLDRKRRPSKIEKDRNNSKEVEMVKT
jgi:hypothetical protein